MFISIKPKPISNNSKVYLIKSFRDEQGKTKQRIIKDFGNYYELLKEDKHFLEKLKANVKNLETDFSQKNLDVNKEYNFGYFFIVRMILSMKLRIFILNRTRNKNEYLYKWFVNEIIRTFIKKDLFENRYAIDSTNEMVNLGRGGDRNDCKSTKIWLVVIYIFKSFFSFSEQRHLLCKIVLSL